MIGGMNPAALMRRARMQAASPVGGALRPDMDSATLPMGQMVRTGGPDQMPAQSQFGLSQARNAMMRQPPMPPIPNPARDAGSFFDVFGRP